MQPATHKASTPARPLFPELAMRLAMTCSFNLKASPKLKNRIGVSSQDSARLLLTTSGLGVKLHAFPKRNVNSTTTEIYTFEKETRFYVRDSVCFEQALSLLTNAGHAGLNRLESIDAAKKRY